MVRQADVAPAIAAAAETRAALPIESVLAGEWRSVAGGVCFCVEHRTPRSAALGTGRIGDVADSLTGLAHHAHFIAKGTAVAPPFLFIDLETTGLAGGAGTYPFLVGCGAFDDEGAFVTRQYLLVRFSDEPVMLEAVAAEIGRAGALVSFNGKSFDAPLLETRFLFHRRSWVGEGLPHIDVLHPARQFWGPSAADRHEERADPTPSTAGCSLRELEEHVLGADRVGDVSGYQIPERYFRFVRTGDVRPLAVVLDHNRLDLMSLAGLTARLLHLVAGGAAEARTSRELLALGNLYARHGLEERALEPLGLAAASADGAIRIEALRTLARTLRRLRRYREAATCWVRLLEVSGCPAHLAREANEALAVHHEHRARDLETAKRFAAQALQSGAPPAWRESVRHRLDRIDRKIRNCRFGDLQMSIAEIDNYQIEN